MNNETVLIIEDSEFTSALIEDYLLSQNFVVCGIASSFYEAQTLFEIHQPTIIICDIHLDGNKNGIECIKTIKLNFPHPLVIFISSDSKREILLKAQKTKPHAYLTKPFTKDQLLTAIEMAIIIRQGNHYSNYNLTDKEIEVLRLLGEGKSNKQIGEELFISHHTVDSRRRKIMLKLNVNSINQALCIASEKEWFQVETYNALIK